MPTRRLIIAFVGAVVLSATAAIIVHRAHASSQQRLSRFSTAGRDVTPSRGSVRAFRIDSIRLLAVRDGRAFYELDTADGRCFGVGSAEAIGDPGGEVCPGGAPFPSMLRPILDFSVYEASPGTDRDDLTIFRIEGFAADGVTTVGVLNRARKVSLRLPVADNVYVLSHVPPGLTGSVVPLDGDGNPIGVR
jgi:hypothetical protein